MFRVHYESQRKELWDWYWRTWRQGRWKVHAVLFGALSAGFFFSNGAPAYEAMGVLRSMVLAFIAIGFLVIYPQIRFKPQMRTIVLDKEGLKTTIGKKSGSRSWKELKLVEEQSDYIIITAKNGNAFIIPPRAFSSAENRAAFLSFALSSIPA